MIDPIKTKLGGEESLPIVEKTANLLCNPKKNYNFALLGKMFYSFYL